MRNVIVVASWLGAIGCRSPAEAKHFEAGIDAATGRRDANIEDAYVVAAPFVRVATWNVHRFFDRVCESAVCGGGAYEELPDETTFAERTMEIARAVRRLDADVVLLQEVESQASLDALTTELGADIVDAVLGEIGTPASVDVAVLSRFPVLGVRRHRDRRIPLDDGGTTTFARELLEVQIDSPVGDVVVFAAHFRSMVDDEPARRVAEARAAAGYAQAVGREQPDAIVVLGGDLNDVPGSDTLAAIEESGVLVRVARVLSDADAATYEYFGRSLALDHLYLDSSASGDVVRGSVRVRRDSTRGFGGSDHAALVADFVSR